MLLSCTGTTSILHWGNWAAFVMASLAAADPTLRFESLYSTSDEQVGAALLDALSKPAEWITVSEQSSAASSMTFAAMLTPIAGLDPTNAIRERFGLATEGQDTISELVAIDILERVLSTTTSVAPESHQVLEDLRSDYTTMFKHASPQALCSEFKKYLAQHRVSFVADSGMRASACVGHDIGHGCLHYAVVSLVVQ